MRSFMVASAAASASLNGPTTRSVDGAEAGEAVVAGAWAGGFSRLQAARANNGIASRPAKARRDVGFMDLSSEPRAQTLPVQARPCPGRLEPFLSVFPPLPEDFGPAAPHRGGMSTETIRVVIADDELLYRERVTTALASEPGVSIVGTAADGDEAIGMIRALRPDVAILDTEMPRLGGLEVAARCGPASASAGGAPVIIFLSGHSNHAVS